MTDKFDRLISVLEKELKLTGTEIAETLWLAMQRPFYSSSQTQKTPSGDKTTTVKNQPTNTTTTPETSSSPKDQDSTFSTISQQTPYAEVSSKNDSTSINKSSLPIKAPDASSLRNPLKTSN